MHLKISNIDLRSQYYDYFPPTSLGLLLALSTTSIGTLILFEDFAYAYSEAATSEVEVSVQDKSFTDSELYSLNADSAIEHSTKQQQVLEKESNGSNDWEYFTQDTSTPQKDESAISVSQFNIPESLLIGDSPSEPTSIESPASNVQLNSADSDLSLDLIQEFDQLKAEFDQAAAIDPASTPLEAAPPEALSEPTAWSADALLPDGNIPALDITQGFEPLAQTPDSDASPAIDNPRREPVITLQGVYLLEGDESSARARLSGSYAITPNILVGTTLDLTTGDAFTDSEEDGFDVNELYVTVAPSELPGLRVVVGMIDLTSYFDRNSFAKDAATHFFNPVFQTNPALAASGIGSRPGVLLNWDITDNLSIRGTTFSSDRDLDDFAFDGAAAEVALRLDNLIVRGTYATDRDAGQQDGFQEIFQFDRGDEFGLLDDDRETAYGINAEWFVPEINLGLFARYGWYENQALNENGNTYSFGINVLDLFFDDDRLGLGYGRALSNNDLRRDRDDEIPDVVELFYDARITPNLRAGVTVQGRDAWSETVLGLRVRADFNFAELGR
ncbi:MAG: hypothetical protein Kow00121_25870 [Elainellaceae cyanobacterium]